MTSEDKVVTAIMVALVLLFLGAMASCVNETAERQREYDTVSTEVVPDPRGYGDCVVFRQHGDMWATC
ncbi:hypothetical protein JRC04_05090 [Mycolicibacterium sp. S2-37]|uniref:hypothetical protein n=1 Tax=Mycolicibacterium sp. S2-37 TaxID=2810297 RepID=UPI001A950989|nr:hypothetical protein [Mycolicibacterium sp. S2-37]MBO0676833.1 hypothetical protein [Mycolicibacterium sp. S2-37]